MSFLSDTLGALGLGGFSVSQGYGANPNNARYGYGAGGHQGVDIGAPSGSPVKMPWTGTLIAGNEPGGFGNYLKAVRPDGFTVLIGHLSEFVGIRPGQTINVQGGQVIGKTGNTGNSHGAHAHVQFLSSPSVSASTGINPSTLTGSVSPGRRVPLLNPVGLPGFTVPTFGTDANGNTTTQPFTGTGEVAADAVQNAAPGWLAGMLAGITASDWYVNTVAFIVGLCLAGLGVLLLAPSFISIELPTKESA